MLALELHQFATVPEGVRGVEVPEPHQPGKGEILARLAYASINPAELLLVEGRYASRPELPVRVGIEGSAVVEAVGEDVESVRPGDLVMSLLRTNWTERLLLRQGQFVKLPEGFDARMAAMLKVNPATAQLMLSEFVNLQPGEWVLQNAANSAVGVLVIQLAKQRGLRTINLVRRSNLEAELKALGADVVLTDSENLPEQVREIVGSGVLRLALDAVAGPAVERLAAGLDTGGTVLNYGLLSGQPCHISPNQLVFRDITLQGFWLAKTLGAMKTDEVCSLYQGLAKQLSNLQMQIPVEQVYGLSDHQQALLHAARSGRNGKILFRGS